MSCRPCRAPKCRQCARLEPVTGPTPRYMNNCNFRTPHPTASPGQLVISTTSPDSKSDAFAFWRRVLAPTRKAIAGGSHSTANTLTCKVLSSTENNIKPTPFWSAHHTRASAAHSHPRTLAPPLPRVGSRHHEPCSRPRLWCWTALSTNANSGDPLAYGFFLCACFPHATQALLLCHTCLIDIESLCHRISN